MGRITRKVYVAQLTLDGRYQYPWHRHETGDAQFTRTLNTCYFDGRVFKKIKGGERGGNYRGEDGEVYRISQHDK